MLSATLLRYRIHGRETVATMVGTTPEGLIPVEVAYAAVALFVAIVLFLAIRALILWLRVAR